MNTQRNMAWVALAFALSTGACSLLTEPYVPEKIGPDFPDPDTTVVYPDGGYVRACKGAYVHRGCVRDSHWGNERAPGVHNENIVPLPQCTYQDMCLWL